MVPPRLRVLAGAALVVALSGCDPVLIPPHQDIPPGVIYAAPTADGEMAGASCLNDDDCWAVGRTSPTLRDSRAVLDHFQAKGWGPASAPDPGAAAALYAVTCLHTATCWAVGSYSRDATENALIEQSIDGRWAAVQSPTSVFDARTSLEGVTCFTAGNCWAVGSAHSATGLARTLLEHYAGGGPSRHPRSEPVRAPRSAE